MSPTCETCGTDITHDAAPCVTPGQFHHATDDCGWDCPACDDARAHDHAEDIAHDRRQGIA